MPVKYEQWDELDREGAYVYVPGVEPAQISHLAKAYVRKRLGPEAKVVTSSTPRGAFVAVAYLPTVVEDTRPGVTYVQPRPPTQRELDKRAKDQERREREMEERNERADTLARSRSKIASDSAGFPAWKRNLTPEEIEAAAKADRHAARVQAAISEGITGKEFADIVAEGDDL